MKQQRVYTLLFRFAVFFVLLFVMDFIIGSLFNKAYFNQHVGQFSQTTYAIDSASQDVMVFGSSRAVRHYATSTITKELGLSCYNSGRDGQMIPYSAAVQEVSIKRHKPKLIILDINYWELANNPSKYEKLTILLPYCKKHKELINYISEVSDFERYKLLSKVYPYNSSAFILVNNAFFPNKVKKDDNGYLPLEGIMTQDELNKYSENMQVRYEKIKEKKDIPDQKAVDYFKKFLDNAARNDIKTLVVISPVILKNSFYLDNQALEKNIITEIAGKYPNVSFLDYSADPRFNNHPEKFSDVFHLNKTGSEEFSAVFSKYIKDNHLLQ